MVPDYKAELGGDAALLLTDLARAREMPFPYKQATLHLLNSRELRIREKISEMGEGAAGLTDLDIIQYGLAQLTDVLAVQEGSEKIPGFDDFINNLELTIALSSRRAKQEGVTIAGIIDAAIKYQPNQN